MLYELAWWASVSCVVGYFLQPGQFFRSYLMAYMFWLGVVLGCLALLMLHHLVGGLWGMVIRRVLESVTRLRSHSWLCCLCHCCLVYPNSTPGLVPALSQGHGTEQFRHLYLQVPFFSGVLVRILRSG